MNVELTQASKLDGIIAGYRECHASQDKSDKGGEKDIALIRRLLFDFHPSHESPIEHAIYTWRVSGVSRALTHQLVRHRIASYSQRSQRYVNETEFEYVIPPTVMTAPGTITIEDDYEGNEELTCKEFFETVMADLADAYIKLRDAGVPREDCRMVLPNACTSSVVVTMNPRSFRNFLKLRLDKKAQWEIRMLAYEMYKAIPEDHKFMYEDIVNVQ